MQKIVQSQVDFTGGEIDPQGKRRIDDHPLAKASCRALSNWRPRTTGTLDVRPGRRALAITTGVRAERFRMTPTQELVIVFSVGAVSILDLAGDTIATNTSSAYLWTAATIVQISWCVCPDRIVICFPGMQPQLIMWSAQSNTFTFTSFAFDTSLNNSMEPFFRFTARGATMEWNADDTNYNGTGNSFTLTCSIPFFTRAMIGSLLSICGAQVVITNVSGSGTPSAFATVGTTPDAIAIDSHGNLYVANYGSNTISKVTRGGSVTTFASGFNEPRALAFDSLGNLYVANYGAGTISKVTPAGTVTTFATVGTNPISLSFDSAGNLWVANAGSTFVSMVTPAGVVSSIYSSLAPSTNFTAPSAILAVGTTIYVGDTGALWQIIAGVAVPFSTLATGPYALAADQYGNIYAANYGSGDITKVTPAAAYSNFATVGTGPSALAFDSSGNLYVANYGSGTVSIVTPNGTVSAFATVGSDPAALAFDGNGNLYCANRGAGTITKIPRPSAATSATVTNNSMMPLGAQFTGCGDSTNAFDPDMFPAGILAQGSYDGAQIEVAGTSGSGSSGVVFGMAIIANLYSDPTGSTQSLISELGGIPSNLSEIYTGDIQTVQWQQEFMSAIAGWPSACFFDRDRLGFCGFPQMPEAILWSAIGLYGTFWVDSAAAENNPDAGADPTSAILEFIAGKPTVKNVTGWTGDQFVFTDKGVFEIPIAAAQQADLAPGSVQFIQLSDDSANYVRPVLTKNALIFVNGGGTRVAAILRSSVFTASVYIAQDLTEYYEHLIKNPVWITASQGDGQYPERYIYVCNDDGTLAIGRITGDQPMGTKQFVGWQPWNGVGNVLWVSASLGTVYYLTQYGTTNVVEVEDDSVFLDHAIFVNSAVPNMLLPGVGPPPGDGPFSAFAGGTVRLMNGEIDYGLRNVDANGNMIWGVDDDQSVSTMIAGQPFSSTLQPFVHEASAEKDPDVKQRQRRRRVCRGIVTVEGSSGFVWGDREIPPYDWGADPTQQPTLQETAYTCRPIGRDYDPPPPILTKDYPGPLTVIEISLEVTV